MPGTQYDTDEELILDGNAAAGLLHEVFGSETTAAEARCAACGAVHPVGELLVYGGAMGSVLRCPDCEEMMLRIVSTDNSLWLDMRGASYLRRGRVTD